MPASTAAAATAGSNLSGHEGNRDPDVARHQAAELRRVAHVDDGGLRLLCGDGAEILLDGGSVEIGGDDAIDVRGALQILDRGASLDAGADDEDGSSLHDISRFGPAETAGCAVPDDPRVHRHAREDQRKPDGGPQQASRAKG